MGGGGGVGESGVGGRVGDMQLCRNSQREDARPRKRMEKEEGETGMEGRGRKGEERQLDQSHRQSSG